MKLRLRKKVEAVYGKTLPAPRMTHGAIKLMLVYVGLPIVALGVVLDVMVWAIARAAFDVCIGLWCWLG